RRGDAAAVGRAHRALCIGATHRRARALLVKQRGRGVALWRAPSAFGCVRADSDHRRRDRPRAARQRDRRRRVRLDVQATRAGGRDGRARRGGRVAPGRSAGAACLTACTAGGKLFAADSGRLALWIALADDALIEAGQTFFIFRTALPQAGNVLEATALETPTPGLESLVPSFANELERFRTVAKSRLPVLLQGETGTGKEVIASAIHQLSGRSGPFLPVNCGALPATLVESEMFGYRKGAFSGAMEDRPGLIRSAEGGTLLLDEIGDLPLPAQATLLRVLQEEEVMPVGGTRPTKVDVRVIAATHRDLPGLVAQEKFR